MPMKQYPCLTNENVDMFPRKYEMADCDAFIGTDIALSILCMVLFVQFED
jgi:hypothetical protein